MEANKKAEYKWKVIKRNKLPAHRDSSLAFFSYNLLKSTLLVARASAERLMNYQEFFLLVNRSRRTRPTPRRDHGLLNETT